MNIPYAFHSYRDYNIAMGRWDQLWLERVILGEEHRPPAGFTFVNASYEEVIDNGGILVLPVGAYHEHGDKHEVLREIRDDLLMMPWGVVFSTSDECDRFEWFKIDPWPDHIQLYVQLPRPGHVYPPGTRFFGEGSPVSVVEIQAGAAYTRDLDLVLVGQGGHQRRIAAFEAVAATCAELDLQARVGVTEGFTLGMDQDEYLFHLTRSWVAPAPSGVCSPSSFRAFEAFEAGAIPLLDDRSPKHNIGGYWRMVGMAEIAPMVVDWNDNLPGIVSGILERRYYEAARVSSFWQRYKRRFVEVIHDDAAAKSGHGRSFDFPSDQITVVILTSPVPSNPDLEMIHQTIHSIRLDLPTAEILIACDGVRAEQEHRRTDYEIFLQRLTQWCLDQVNITPFVFDEHLHQSGMWKRMIHEVRTPYLMFVEHDCPLVQPVDFGDVVSEMQRAGINHMRFLHEPEVPPEWGYLYLETEPTAPDRFIRTVQYSARPSVIRTDWFRDLLDTYFSDAARTMIEDVIHGAWQVGLSHPTNGSYAARKQLLRVWRRHRGAVWADAASLAFSGHADGRGGDLKYDMVFDYPEETPPGVPQPTKDQQ